MVGKCVSCKDFSAGKQLAPGIILCYDCELNGKDGKKLKPDTPKPKKSTKKREKS